MTGILEHESSSSAAPDPWLGCILGDRYRIEEWIGQGGMGVVYRGHHLELGKRVAIKRLDPRIASDPTSFERFRREAIAASHIESPHVVHVFDWGKAPDGSPYLVMELLEGSDLRSLFQREGRLLPEQAAAITGQILRALVRTHQARIVHRDLKPENVFLCRYDADDLHVKLLDFGISKRTSEETQSDTVTRRGVILGTASYMSPEQARGESTLDGRSDLFSVGTILFESLSGRVPHRARTYEGTLIDICTRDADDVRLHAPLVPEALAQVVARSLQRDVDLRFQSAKEFLEALLDAVPSVGRVLAEHPTGPSTATIAVHAPRVASAKRWTAAVLFLAVAAAVLVLLRNQDRPTVSEPISLPSSSSRAANTTPAATTITSSAPIATEPVMTATAASAAKQNVNPPSGSANGRPPSPRPGTSTNAPTSGPNDRAGVASGLKLRRTMP